MENSDGFMLSPAPGLKTKSVSSNERKTTNSIGVKISLACNTNWDMITVLDLEILDQYRKFVTRYFLPPSG